MLDIKFFDITNSRNDNISTIGTPIKTQEFDTSPSKFSHLDVNIST